MFRKPFVYFSEAIVTPTKSTSIISSKAAQYGGTPLLPVQDLWTKAALSVTRQAALYRHKGYKGEAWHHWLNDTVEMIANGIHFDKESGRHPFKAELMSTLGKPSIYYVPDETREFIDLLTESGIGWGIIANENHMYQAILKFLRLNPPGPVVPAAGPTLFKPLPSIWARAAARAPAQSKHDTWFVGSVLHPCDNMALNSSIRCALVAPHISEPDPASQHFRISCLNDLKTPLLGAFAHATLPDFDAMDEPAPFEDDDDVVLRGSTVPPPLSRSGQELSLASIKKKTNV